MKKWPPSLYVRPPRCRACLRRGTLRPDRWMNNRWKFQSNCTCSGYWFIHRKGSRFCHFRANGEERQLTDPDFRDRSVMNEALTDEERELFEERAAIIEFDGGLSRDEAEQMSINLLRGNQHNGSLHL